MPFLAILVLSTTLAWPLGHEVVERFGWTERRRRLLDGLADAIEVKYRLSHPLAQ